MMCLQVSVMSMEKTAELGPDDYVVGKLGPDENLHRWLVRSIRLMSERAGPASNSIIIVSHINWTMKIQKNAGHHEG